MPRLAVMAHYDPSGLLAPHAKRQVLALAEAFDELIVVSTAELRTKDRAWLDERTTLIERTNEGYDFFSYKVGLEAAQPHDRFDEIAICNDSYIGPLRSYDRIMGDMADRDVAFWGLTSSREISPHLQSFFVVFRREAYQSLAFRRFWSDLVPVSDRMKVIRRYEIGLTKALSQAGYKWAAYFRPTADEIRRARRRGQWWALHKPKLRRNPRRYRTIWRAGMVFNPCAALADSALDDGRLPLVKLDTLRYDPVRLDADGLLRYCEERFPAEFEGVREYMQRTADFYSGRHRTYSTPWFLRPFGRTVRYALRTSAVSGLPASGTA